MARFQGLVFRALEPVFSSSPHSGEGAKKCGGRFNPIGVAALYTSLTEGGVLAEHNQGFSHRPQPKTICAYDVDCEDIIDLTSSKERSRLGIELDDLSCGWELTACTGGIPPSGDIATKLIKDSIAGIIVPSFAINASPSRKNVVFWKWSTKPPHQVKIIDDSGRLPHNQNSWS
ncbi:MAG: RES domain-containing protein [Candidatus Polarisedimenticolaceae bacterium]|nr:RES domain-containing protein [Candidatus Polarisedimenticolaceae bacterium]